MNMVLLKVMYIRSNSFVHSFVCALMEEHKLQVFGSKDLRKVFGPEKDATSGQFRILHSKDAIYTDHLGE